jgi:hypothetical protein
MHSRESRSGRCSLMWRVSGDTARLITSPLEFDSRRRNHAVRQERLPQLCCAAGTTAATMLCGRNDCRNYAVRQERLPQPFPHFGNLERWCSWSAHLFEAQKVLVQFQVSRPRWGVGQSVGQSRSCRNPGFAYKRASALPGFGFVAEPLKLSLCQFESDLPRQKHRSRELLEKHWEVE